MDYPYREDWWETKDHREIKIEDMETSHIVNTIKYLEKHKDFYDTCVGDNWFGYDYEDNSHLVEKKIEELKYELKRRPKYVKTENGYKISMPLITKEELDCIDLNFHSIVDEYIKEFSNKKEKTIEQRLIYDLEQENKQLKERIEYLERSNNRREDEILSLRQELINKEE